MLTAKNPSIVILIILSALLVITTTGCVERKLTIKTEPDSALVVLNDEEIGLSPVTVSFNWYGDYRIRITKPGFETLNTHQELTAPWYDKFPYDFFAEVLCPKMISDSYEWNFQLTPYTEPDRQDLIKAAQELKSQASESLPGLVQ